MRTVRRATLIRVMTRAAVIIILLDALLYFGVVVPLGTSVTKQSRSSPLRAGGLWSSKRASSALSTAWRA